jgi:outer membrane protein assembly factor BamB
MPIHSWEPFHIRGLRLSERVVRMTRATLSITPLVLALALSGCGGGGGGASTPAVVATTAGGGATSGGTTGGGTTTTTSFLLPALASIADTCTDCWPMFMHDRALSGYQPTQTGISSSTVANLQLRWSHAIGEQVVSSPVTGNGSLYVVTGAGSVIAFDVRTGTQQWRTQLGGPVSMSSPTLDSGLLFVATHTPPAKFFALDAASGTIRWQASVPGSIRGAPTVADGMVLIGEAGGDPPACHQGGVHAYQENDGAPLWTWHTLATPGQGGAVWSAIAFGGKDFIIGTGNACSAGQANANSVIRLTPQGTQEWLIAQEVNSSTVDDDWGGGAAISNGRFFIANKNGYFYAVDGLSGKVLWKYELSPLDGFGPFATPATNGSIVVMPTGFITYPTWTNSPASAAVLGFNQGGAKLWSIPTHDKVNGGVSLTNDIALIGLDLRLGAFDINTGKELWSFNTPDGLNIQAPPIVVSSGVYAVDVGGMVYAVSEGTTAAGTAETAAALRALQAASAKAPPLRMPYGPITRRTSDGLQQGVY